MFTGTVLVDRINDPVEGVIPFARLSLALRPPPDRNHFARGPYRAAFHEWEQELDHIRIAAPFRFPESSFRLFTPIPVTDLWAIAREVAQQRGLPALYPCQLHEGMTMVSFFVDEIIYPDIAQDADHQERQNKEAQARTMATLAAAQEEQRQLEREVQLAERSIMGGVGGEE